MLGAFRNAFSQSFMPNGAILWGKRPFEVRHFFDLGRRTLPEWLGFLPTDISASWPLALAAEIFRTDDGRTNGIVSAGRTKMFRPVGRTGGWKSFGHPDGRTPERTDGRTNKKNEKIKASLKR